MSTTRFSCTPHQAASAARSMPSTVRCARHASLAATWLTRTRNGAVAFGIAFGFIFASNAAQAADTQPPVIGEVVAVRGAVFFDAGTVQQPLVVKAPVHRGDSIVSAAGKAQIGLLDGTIISVGENSRVRVADYDASGAGTRARLGLVSGVLRLLVNKISPSGHFEVETETAVAAVRGTDWVIEATPEKTAVAIVTGVVAVSGRAAPASPPVVLDAAGQGTDVPRGGAPSPPTRWGQQRFADTLARATFQ